MVHVVNSKIPTWAVELFSNALADAQCDKPVHLWYTSRRSGYSDGVTVESPTGACNVRLDLNSRAPLDSRWVILHEASHVIAGAAAGHSTAFYIDSLARYDRFGIRRNWALWRESMYQSAIRAARALGWDQGTDFVDKIERDRLRWVHRSDGDGRD